MPEVSLYKTVRKPTVVSIMLKKVINKKITK